MIFTFLIAAKQLIRSLFIMFDCHDAATKLAFFIDRLIPQDKITMRIFATAVKDTALLRFPFNQGAFAAFRARNPHIFDDGFRIATFREIGTCQKLAKTAKFIYHGRTTKFTDFA